jgi:NADH:ubiquinone oxidoreductase subunit 6 (subunit J)
MNFTLITFYFFVIAAFIAALAIVLSKNIFKSALLLLVCLLSIAALFIMSNAEFLGVTQILIYAGGILVIILFGIMFTSTQGTKTLHVKNTNLFSGVLVGILVFSLLAKLILKYTSSEKELAIHPSHSIETIGDYLVTDYSLPFEAVGVLLLITLIGASVITAFMKLKRS